MSSASPDSSSRLRAAVKTARRIARPVLGPVYDPLRRLARFVAWSLPALRGLLVRPRPGQQRILAIYDTTSQPFSVGDMLLCQVASLVLSEQHGAEVVDFAVVYDPVRPDSSNPVFAGTITDENILYHLASILPVAQVNPLLGSIHVFNSASQLHAHVSDNLPHYHVWPSGWKVSTREYVSPAVFNDLLYHHHKRHGSVPRLSCRPFLKAWAEEFYRQHAPGLVPVTVNLRNNQAWHTYRNSQLDAWLGFFRQCEGRYPAKFVVICARSEIDDRLRGCPNVILAKDHQTGVEQDMALIHSSAMHMGANSGPATMAWFNDKPYVMVNTDIANASLFFRPDMVVQAEERVQRFWFAKVHQRLAADVETVALLEREFALMWQHIKPSDWTDAAVPMPDRPTRLDTWLR